LKAQSKMGLGTYARGPTNRHKKRNSVPEELIQQSWRLVAEARQTIQRSRELRRQTKELMKLAQALVPPPRYPPLPRQKPTLEVTGRESQDVFKKQPESF
jgi:hypothetical protein